MAIVVLGVDALDPEIVDPDRHPNLTLDRYQAIETIVSSSGEPSTHELWPTIITGLEPEEHGLLLEQGVTWENPVLAAGSRIGNYLVPEGLRTRIGAWLLNNTQQDAFRTSVGYYEDNDIETVFDDHEAVAIGVPNYVTDPDEEDREHQLRRSMGELFERDPDTGLGHHSSDPETFYQQCLEMAMVRVARVRRALRSRRYELVFGYTSGLDLIGHVSVQRQGMQAAAYDELDVFVGELRRDLEESDELLLVSDHGLQDGVHTHTAMVASTDPELVERISSVTDVRSAIERALEEADEAPQGRSFEPSRSDEQSDRVAEQLEDLGYL